MDGEQPEYAIVRRDMTDPTIPHAFRPRAGEHVKIIWVDSTGTALIESTRHSSPMRLFIPEDDLARMRQ